MKKVFLLFILLFTSHVQAYSKKIIFASFSNKANANKSLNAFKKTFSYTKLNNLAIKNGFKIYIRQSGKYYIVVAEPIKLESVGIKAYKLVNQEYEKVNLNTYLAQEIVSVEDIKRVKPIEKYVEKKVKIKEKIVTTKTKTSSNYDIDIWSILKYVLIISFFFILIYYYIKLKRIYNQY